MYNKFVFVVWPVFRTPMALLRMIRSRSSYCQISYGTSPSPPIIGTAPLERLPAPAS